MNPAVIAQLRQRIAQLRGEARQLRGSNAQLRTLLRRSVSIHHAVAEFAGPERVAELDIFLAHVREVLEHTDDADHHPHPLNHGAQRRP